MKILSSPATKRQLGSISYPFLKIDFLIAIGITIDDAEDSKELAMLFRRLRHSDVARPVLISMVALMFCAACVAGPHPVAQDAEGVTGWWSRIMNGTQGLMREVVEFRPDGTYTSGICALATQNGWCSGKAVSQIQGAYSLRGDTLTLQNGLILQESLEDFGNPNAPLVDLTKAGPEEYRWRLEVTLDNPLTGNRPARTLYLADANNQPRQYNDMDRIEPPEWQNR